MTKQRKTVIIVLVILNSVVLMGQLWPQGAPPFAGVVNIVTLLVNLLFFLSMLRK